MTPEPAPRARAALRWLLWAALLVAASWPWLATIGYWPMAPDTLPWVERADPAAPGWARWVFGTVHFQVGYRPLTALSFTLDRWLSGPAATTMRWTDLALHLGCALALAGLVRALVPGAPRWAGPLAAALWLLHPAAEEVVPFSARRSYALALVLGLLGAALGCRVAARPGGPSARVGPSLAVGALLALGLLAHAVGGLTVAAYPFLVASVEARRGAAPGALSRVAAAGVGPVLFVGAALLARTQVLGDEAGYALEEEQRAAFLPAVQAALHGLSGLGFARRRGALFGDLPYGLLLAAFALVHVGSWRAARRTGGRARQGGLLAPALTGLGWSAAIALAAAAQGVWFRRLVQPMVAPFALYLVLALVAAGRAGRRGWAAAQVALLVALQLTSPVLSGPDPRRVEKWRPLQDLTGALIEEGRGVERGLVLCVLPYRDRPEEDGPRQLHERKLGKELSRAMRLPFRWAAHLVDTPGADGRELREALYVLEEGEPWTAAPRLEERFGAPWVVLAGPRRVLASAGGRRVPSRPAEGEAHPLAVPEGEARPVSVFLYRAQGGALERWR